MYRPTNPDQTDVLFSWLHQQSLETHTSFPARVVSYDAATQSADLQPLLRQQVPQPDGSNLMEDLPTLPSVPVMPYRAGVFFVSLPLQAGDTVLVVCGETDISRWWARTDGTAVTDPGDTRRHALAHAVAIPGLSPRSKALAHASATDLVIGSDDGGGTRLAFKPDGSLVVTQGSTTVLQIDATGTVHVGGDAGDQFVALANLVDANLSQLAAIIAAAPTVAQDGGAAFKAALTAWQPQTTAATKTKGV